MDFYTCFILFLLLFFLSSFFNGDVIDIEHYTTWHLHVGVSRTPHSESVSLWYWDSHPSHTLTFPPISLVFKTPVFTISVHGTTMHTATHSRKGKSTTTAALLSYTAPRWETSAALQHYLSVQLSPLHYSQNILVTLASWNSQLCLLHSLSSVCVQSFCAAAWELYPGKKLGLGDIGQPRGSPC